MLESLPDMEARLRGAASRRQEKAHFVLVGDLSDTASEVPDNGNRDDAPGSITMRGVGIEKDAKKLPFEHPFDTPLSSGLRFLVEVIAWVAGPWAVAQQSAWLIAPAILILVGLPSMFSTRGDKRQIIVATPGALRALLEVALHVVAITAAWLVWPTWLAVAVTVVVVAALATGIPRMRWLIRGAPLTID
ncbi:MAG: hypothetical protein JRF42_10765 [Deltaproteobacteria bacterium]|nr:hypothetical protein [Deltaproteobacteria bacterium]